MSPWLHRLSRRLNQDALAIVMVHGVSDLPLEEASTWNPDGKHLHVSVLEEALELFARDFHSIPLDSWVQRRQGGVGTEASSLTLTFDDGYGDFERLVLPILERHNIHACLFPVIQALDGQRLWMDVMSVGEKITLPGGVNLSRLELKQRLKRMTALERKQFLLGIHDRESEEADTPLPMMGWDELVRLSKHPLVTVGNHTLSHSTLSREDDENLLCEIGDASQRLVASVGSCSILAYPHGTPDDFDDRAKAAARATGHHAALTTVDGLADGSSDLFSLPRLSLSTNTWASGYFLNGLYGLRRLKSRLLS